MNPWWASSRASISPSTAKSNAPPGPGCAVHVLRVLGRRAFPLRGTGGLCCHTVFGAQIDKAGGAYVLSLKANQLQALKAVASHFASNPASCHWTLDVVFSEDLCGTRDATASRNLSTLREMAIGLLLAHPSKKTLPLKQQQATLDPQFRLSLLEKFHA